jgi:hypothetical protein
VGIREHGRVGRWVAVAVAVGALTIAACSNDDSDAKGGPPGAAPRTSVSTTTTPGNAEASAFEGLARADAIAHADAENRPWRIGREDDETFPVTLDFNERRVTFEIDDGVVTTARFG